MNDVETGLTQAELRDFRRIAGIMIPVSTQYRMPGADDEAIFADIVRSLGRDSNHVRKALAMLHEMAGGDFAGLDAARAEATAMALLGRGGAAIAALGRAAMQCYYRDNRVIAALGLEPRPPFPKGHSLEESDWSLLDAVRGRPRMWRDIDGVGA